MKKSLLKLLLFSFAMTMSVVASAQQWKYYMGVTGYDNNHENPATVGATVYDNFAFSIKFPEPTTRIGARYADLDVRMTKVGTLGLQADEVRSLHNEYDTKVTVSEQKLGDWLPNCYALADAKVVSVPVTVYDYIVSPNKQQSFTYTIAGVEGSQIVGTPSNTDDARTAWHIITDEVTSVRDMDSHDSKFILKQGAYFQFGDEKITAKQDIDLLANSWSMSSVGEQVMTDFDFDNQNISNPKQVQIYFPAETALKMDNSIATLNNAVTITFDCSSLADGELSGILSDVVSGTDGSNGSDGSLTIQKILTLFDTVIGFINEAGTIPCTVVFGEAPTVEPTEVLVDVYPGSSSVKKNQTLAQFASIRATYPNAIAFANSEIADQVAGIDNVVVEYEVGNNGNKYYECENLVLVDEEDFYTPYNFIAASGSYYRWIWDQSNSCCLPFALDKEKLSSGTQLLTFAYYEPIIVDGEKDKDGRAFVYFNSNNIVNGGVPCFIYHPSGFPLNVQFDNTEIVSRIEASSNLKGTYSHISVSSDFYGITDDGKNLQAFGPEGETWAFRSMLTLTWDEPFNGGSNHSGSYSAKELRIAIIGQNGEATTIDGVKIPTKNSLNNIYTINGVQVSSMSKAGLYIVDGKKVYVK